MTMYLEVLDYKGNWSNEIGDYNGFSSIQDVEEAIAILEKQHKDLEVDYDFAWRLRVEGVP